MSRLKNKKGFTLIELVIVLAIAALIIAAVLFAVNGAQVSRRDTQRKNDGGRVASYMEQWASNNSGAYPSTQAMLTTATPNFNTTYMTPNKMVDPRSGVAYTLTYALGTTSPAVGTIDFSINATCSGPVAVAAAGQARKYAVVIGLEQGGSDCFNN